MQRYDARHVTEQFVGCDVRLRTRNRRIDGRIICVDCRHVHVCVTHVHCGRRRERVIKVRLCDLRSLTVLLR